MKPSLVGSQWGISFLIQLQAEISIAFLFTTDIFTVVSNRRVMRLMNPEMESKRKHYHFCRTARITRKGGTTCRKEKDDPSSNGSSFRLLQRRWGQTLLDIKVVNLPSFFVVVSHCLLTARIDLLPQQFADIMTT